MEKLGLLFKKVSQNRIKDYLKESESFFIVKYSKVSGPELNILRQSLSAINATLFVIKNNVARRAFKDSGLESLVEFISGACGLVFVKDEPVSASRLLYNFSREHENLKLEVGYLKDRILAPKDIEAISRLPSKEIMRAKTVFILKSPISRLAIALKQNLNKLVYCLDQIKNKKTK